MKNDFLLYLNIFSALYYLALIGLIWYKRNQLIGSISLIGLIGANCYALINNSLILSGKIHYLSLFFWLGFIFIPLFAPFFRAHVITLLRQKSRFSFIHIAIGFMWIFSIVQALKFYQLDHINQTIYFEGIVSGDFPEGFKLLNNIFLLVVFVYFIDSGIAAFRKPENKEKNLENLFHQSAKYSRNFWLLLLANYVIVVLFSFFVSMKTIEYCVTPICMNILFFFIIMNLKVYSTEYKFEELEQNNVLTYSEDVLNAVKEALINDQLYLETDCSIEKIANRIDHPKNKVSRAINGGLKVSFNDYLNSLRIGYSKDLLNNYNPVTETIEGVGYSSGFNSKASFYRAFKKFTSQTPTDFINSTKK